MLGERGIMKILRWLDRHFEETVMAVLLIIMTVVMGVQLCARYFFATELPWCGELTQYLLIWSCFISIALCVRHGLSHRVDQLLQAVPAKISSVIFILSTTVELLFFGYLTPRAYLLAEYALRIGGTDNLFPVPVWVLYAAPVTGFILAVLRCGQRIIIELPFQNNRRPQAKNPSEEVLPQ